VRGHIDRLRGTFALLVMVGHAIDVAAAAPPDRWTAMLLPLRPFLGFVWVIGFIVLSGYCITASCLRGRESIGPLQYVQLRVSRLFPLLWASLAVAFVLERSMGRSPLRPPIWTAGLGTESLIINAAGLGGFYGQYASLAPAYTLSYELLFYTCWGVAWFGAGRQTRRALVAASAGVVVLWALTLLLPPLLAVPFNEFVRILYVCWIAGAVLAVYLPRLSSAPIARALAPMRWLILAAVLLWGDAALGMPQTTPSPSAWVYYLLLAAAFAGVIVGFAARGRDVAPHALDRWLGLISYPIFLIHGPIVIFGGYLLARSGFPLGFGASFALLAAASIAVAMVMAVLVERPVMAMRARWRAPRREPLQIAV
jgi:peptidoglycan/LPS O-acetylase OafA/YrhL